MGEQSGMVLSSKRGTRKRETCCNQGGDGGSSTNLVSMVSILHSKSPKWVMFWMAVIKRFQPYPYEILLELSQGSVQEFRDQLET